MIIRLLFYTQCNIRLRKTFQSLLFILLMIIMHHTNPLALLYPVQHTSSKDISISPSSKIQHNDTTYEYKSDTDEYNRRLNHRFQQKIHQTPPLYQTMSSYNTDIIHSDPIQNSEAFRVQLYQTCMTMLWQYSHFCPRDLVEEEQLRIRQYEIHQTHAHVVIRPYNHQFHRCPSP